MEVKVVDGKNDEMGCTHDCENLGFCLPAHWNPLIEKEASMT
jgi:hypothetical protein